jgi:hypothetical protein
LDLHQKFHNKVDKFRSLAWKLSPKAGIHLFHRITLSYHKQL